LTRRRNFVRVSRGRAADGWAGSSWAVRVFSVVIPTFNRREKLLRAVSSVLAQRYTDYEVIVVDDGSSDDTPEALARLGSKVVAIRQPNLGPAAARMAGVRAAKGDYVAFLDSDDLWFPWSLETMARAIERHEHPSWLYGSGVDMDAAADYQAQPERTLSTKFSSSYLAAAASEGLMPLPSGVAVSRSVLLESGGFRAGLHVGEDVDLWFRIREHNGFVLVEAPLLFARERHAGSLGEDIPRSHAGMNELFRNEVRGTYGGTVDAAFVRRAIITRQLMYYAESYVIRGQRRLAVSSYLKVLSLQARSRFREPAFGGSRNRFLLSFFVLATCPPLYGLLRPYLSRRSPTGRMFDRG